MHKKMMLFVFILGVGLSGAALAADSPWYVGMQLGQMRVDLSEFSDTDAVGATLGYKLNDSFAVEGVLMTTGQDGDVTVQGVKGTWSLNTSALYIAYRSSGKFYFKGKAGYLHEWGNISVPGTSFSGNDSGGSYGLGVGWRPGDDLTVELEYTRVEQDVSFIGLGVNFGF